MTTKIQTCPLLQPYGIKNVSTTGFTYLKEPQDEGWQGMLIGEVVNKPAIEACVKCSCKKCFEDIGKTEWELMYGYSD